MASEAALSRPAPVENLTLWQRVYDHLRAEILAGRLEPGTELAEVALAEQLGVSRGPLREAIGRLATEGLVTVRPRRGAVVTPLSKEEFLELYQVREALERIAVKLAVPRLQPDDVAALQALIDEMAARAERNDVAAFFEANAAFHQRLVLLGGNQTLGIVAEMLNEIVARAVTAVSRTDGLGSIAVRRRGIRSQQRLLDLLEEGDGAAAEEHWRAHMQVVGRVMLGQEAATVVDLLDHY